ncbi:hypothetical protein CEE45_17685 [Candidatus Heimdallarchaeota archaeon B3_Heim]|nr:MAG: hypothetical protein CEE45_17685 [Candidatus Heimdallarchaeota archaeon B3_Heim]
MKALEKRIVYFWTFIYVMIGYFSLLVVSDYAIDFFSGIFSAIVIFPKKWGFGVFSLDSLTSTPRLTWFVFAIGWFLVCIFVNYGSTQQLREGAKIPIRSLFFVNLWFISSFAMITGYILWSLIQGYSEVITLDPNIPGNLVDQYLEGFFWVLAPAITVLFGVNYKAPSN